MVASMGTKGLVSLGLVTWNSEKDLPGCIHGLELQEYPHLELIVVDNASVDHSVDQLRERFPNAKYFHNDVNEGYCKPHNQAIRASEGEYYLPLNPDVHMLPGFVQRLVTALETHPDCGSAVGKLWQAVDQESKIIDSTGLFIDRSRHQYLRGHGEIDAAQYDQPEEVFGADGAAPLHRRAMLEDVQIGGEFYDESFFGYMEDVDLAWRSRLLAWKCWYEPQAVAVHARTFKPGRRMPMPSHLRRLAVRNRYLTILKNESEECWRRDWWRILAYDAGILLYLLILEQTSLGAYLMLRREWKAARSWRAKLWKRATASPEEQLSWFV